jgi:xanthine dehydrogenase accessory factor
MDESGVFLKAVSALEAGQPVALVTVISTAGSTPGKVGYRMLVLPEAGGIAGTVGGGLIEATMIERARAILASPTTQVHRFDLGTTEDDEKGICGGSMELLIETFDKTSRPLFEGLRIASDEGNGGLLVSVLWPDHPPCKILLGNASRATALPGGAPLPLPLIAALREAVARQPRGTRLSGEGLEVFAEGLAPAPHLVIFGAGHVSVAVCRFARSVHFRVTVVDDRAEYAMRDRFPDAQAVVVQDFARVLDGITIDADSYVVIVTRGHKWDEAVLEQVLSTPAQYIGMIGSRRKTLAILDRLRQKGADAERLKRVYSPIGLSIGAVTAEEIALSIASELVKIRRLGHASGITHMASSGSSSPLGVGR